MDGQWPLSKDLETKGNEHPFMLQVETVEEEAATVIRDLSPSPIVSRLSYRLATVLKTSDSCYYWMIDGNRIIGTG
jgi:hypothetical protein